MWCYAEVEFGLAKTFSQCSGAFLKIQKTNVTIKMKVTLPVALAGKSATANNRLKGAEFSFPVKG